MGTLGQSVKRTHFYINWIKFKKFIVNYIFKGIPPRHDKNILFSTLQKIRP